MDYILNWGYPYPNFLMCLEILDKSMILILCLIVLLSDLRLSNPSASRSASLKVNTFNL